MTTTTTTPRVMPQTEIIDSAELARRLGDVSKDYVVRNTRRTHTRDPIPHIKLGRRVRYRWGSVEIEEWIKRRCKG